MTRLILPLCVILLNCALSDVIPNVTESPSIGLIKPHKDLSIWIADNQVNNLFWMCELFIIGFVQTKFFSGIHHIMIHVVANGVVMPYLLDRNMETHLPVIPSEVEEVSVGRCRHRLMIY